MFLSRLMHRSHRLDRLMRLSVLVAIVLGAAWFGLPVLGASGPHSPADEGMTTAEHLRVEAWWPTKVVADGTQFAGTKACAECHAEIVASQAKAQMARTLSVAARSGVLHGQLGAQYHSGAYDYSFVQRGGDVVMSVSDGKSTRSAVLQLAFGSGEVGQSYLWRSGDKTLESRFNYFHSIDAFAATPGRLKGTPTSLSMAVGRPLAEFEVKTCVACHTNVMPASLPQDLTQLAGGVRCEGCHGPGAAHVRAARDHAAAVEHGEHVAWDRHIFNPDSFSPVKSVDACGACHSTPWDTRVMGAVGVASVRFPALRLEKSRCWGLNGDSRLTCASCHDPHGPLAREAVSYDLVCLSCHSGGGANHAVATSTETHQGAVCPVAKTKCVSCHMPKFEINEMHAKFTDHDIRVVKTGAPFPD